jgi:hypothetical protein
VDRHRRLHPGQTPTTLLTYQWDTTLGRMIEADQMAFRQAVFGLKET